MSRTVIDASVAIKWVVEEDGTPEALALEKDWRFVTADERLGRKLTQLKDARFDSRVVTLR